MYEEQMIIGTTQVIPATEVYFSAEVPAGAILTEAGFPILTESNFNLIVENPV